MSTASTWPAEKVFPVPAELYDRTIHWEKRLAREAPFFRWLFDRFRIRRILDVACGTGRARRDVSFVGPGGGGIRCQCRNDRLCYQPIRNTARSGAEGSGFFGATSRTGEFRRRGSVWATPLSLLQDPAEIEKALRHMLAAIRPGGVLSST